MGAKATAERPPERRARSMARNRQADQTRDHVRGGVLHERLEAARGAASVESVRAAYKPIRQRSTMRTPSGTVKVNAFASTGAFGWNDVSRTRRTRPDGSVTSNCRSVASTSSIQTVAV